MTWEDQRYIFDSKSNKNIIYFIFKIFLKINKNRLIMKTLYGKIALKWIFTWISDSLVVQNKKRVLLIFLST